MNCWPREPPSRFWHGRSLLSTRFVSTLCQGFRYHPEFAGTTVMAGPAVPKLQRPVWSGTERYYADCACGLLARYARDVYRCHVHCDRRLSPHRHGSTPAPKESVANTGLGRFRSVWRPIGTARHIFAVGAARSPKTREKTVADRGDVGWPFGVLRDYSLLRVNAVNQRRPTDQHQEKRDEIPLLEVVTDV